jgi:hypothetical protein
VGWRPGLWADGRRGLCTVAGVTARCGGTDAVYAPLSSAPRSTHPNQRPPTPQR